MMNRRASEKGFALLMVLVIVGLGTLLLGPMLRLASTTLLAKQIQSDVLYEQYTRDAGGEYAVWDLTYGIALSQLEFEGAVTDPVVLELNGTTTTVIIRMQAELSGLTVPGAEDDKIRVTLTVECDWDASGDYGDSCTDDVPPASVRARYTVTFEQLSPETGDGLEALFAELPKGFDFVAASSDSPDGSITSIPTPTNVGNSQDEIWKWVFGTGCPGQALCFQQEEVKTLRFVVDFNKNGGRWCNAVYLLPNREKSGKTAPIVVDGSSDKGCAGGGVSVIKYVDTLVAPPNELVVFTYLVVMENVDTSTLHIDSIRDVLPHGGFTYQLGSAEIWITGTPLLGLPDDFIDALGFSAFSDDDVTQTLLGSGRWEALFDGPGGAGWNVGAAGGSTDTLIMRFKASVTLTESGSYYNEAFVVVGSGCSAPQALTSEGVFNPGVEDEEYCTGYSWPTGGVIVPTYDVQSTGATTTGVGNITIDWTNSTTQLNSWHVD